MKAKCIENKMRNGNFTVGKTYDVTYSNKNYLIRCDFSLYIRTEKEIENALLNREKDFDFAFCKFEFVK